ncbi:MAG: CotH kinase family protein [Cyclobacteriaceae bacterium]
MIAPKNIFLILIIGFTPIYAQLERVKIEVAQSNIDRLESDPFNSEDVYGHFLGADGVRRDSVDINYRGAYQLIKFISWWRIEQRNWKVKVDKDQRYNNRREWNYNFEPHPRQVMAYLLFKKAGVAAASCRHVKLSLNGKDMGIYSEYEDIDNKRWLTDKFGDNDGDLFKAAFDIPNEPRYFAGLNDLGDDDEDYFWHYRKKTNNNDEAEFDYSLLLEFIKTINDTPDNQFEQTLKENFDTDSFIKYLVVANFISNWDSYPVRPKNYWLYHNPTDNRWTFIPWDLDATFQTETSPINQMGTDASIFYQFDKYEPYNLQPQEGSERPLVRKMMMHESFRNAYILEYQKALKTYLKESTLVSMIDSLKTLVTPSASASDLSTYTNEVRDMKNFISNRTRLVAAEANSFVIEIDENSPLTTNPAEKDLSIFYNEKLIKIKSKSVPTSNINLSLTDLGGKKQTIVKTQYSQGDTHYLEISTQNIVSGIYILQLTKGDVIQTRKIFIP